MIFNTKERQYKSFHDLQHSEETIQSFDDTVSNTQEKQCKSGDLQH